MNQCFKVVSLTHKQAPLAIRELLHTLRQALGLSDVLVLSTCNRTEVSYSAAADCSTAIIGELAARKGRGESGNLAGYFNRINCPALGVQYLFEVAMGLEAQVVGDQQISHQVKTAYQWSVEADAAGPFLHRLLHSVFFTHKRVEQETSFRDGAASTSYATLELVQRLTAHLPSPRVLVLGLGDIGTDICQYFAGSRRFQHVTICNRTRAQAAGVAPRFCPDFAAGPAQWGQRDAATRSRSARSSQLQYRGWAGGRRGVQQRGQHGRPVYAPAAESHQAAHAPAEGGSCPHGARRSRVRHAGNRPHQPGHSAGY